MSGFGFYYFVFGMWNFLLLGMTKPASSFSTTPIQASTTPILSRITVALKYSNNEEEDTFDTDLLQQRLLEMQRRVLEHELRQPPNPTLGPKELVQSVLAALWDHSNPWPDSGFRVLLRSCTPQWRAALYHSVGAPLHLAKEEAVAAALGEAMARPNNQFALLLPTNDDDDHDFPPYTLEFPSDVLDYGDGTCWLECRLSSRRPNNRRLFVVMGWQLQQRTSDNAWLVHRIDWQDFRDQFRPGIGREEWMRVCG